MVQMLRRFASASGQQAKTAVSQAAKAAIPTTVEAAPAAAAGAIKELYRGKHVYIEQHGDVGVVIMDSAANAVNSLDRELADELKHSVEFVKTCGVKAAVVTSNKKGTFSAGADIDMLGQFKTATEIQELIVESRKVFKTLEKGIPVVAAMNGTSLGGGLEVALACDYRLALDVKGAQHGLPEVMLGVLPGFGGTQMLPRLIGLPNALDLMLAGKRVPVAKSKKLGVVDQVVKPLGPGLVSNEEYFRKVAIETAAKLANGSMKLPNREHTYGSLSGLTKYATNEVDLARSQVISIAKKQVMKMTKGNMPAPLEILKCAEIGLRDGIEAGAAYEGQAFAKLAMSSESKALRSIFAGMTALKKNRYGKPTKPCKRIGIIGAGLMGAGIGQISMKKFEIVLKDTQQSGLARGLGQIKEGLDKKVKKKALSSFDRNVELSKVMTTTGTAGLEKADLVIEAVFENIDVKHKVIQSLEAVVPKHCIIATNTSAIPIRDIAKGASRPENVVGMHYFSPVPQMPLLEVIKHEGTSEEALRQAHAVGIAQGKTVIPVGDVPGFYVNRCLGPYMAEMFALVKEGASFDQIDKAITQYGWPMGPFKLGDEVGIDVTYNVQKFLAANLGDRMLGADPSFLEPLIEKGHLGKKAGAGFRMHPKGSKETPLNPLVEETLKTLQAGGGKVADEEIQKRTLCKFINEAALCLQDGIIDSPRDGDMGSVFGVGFPPFRGGPFRLLDTEGVGKYVDMMRGYEQSLSHGKAFTPAQILVDYAKADKKFHSD